MTKTFSLNKNNYNDFIGPPNLKWLIYQIRSCKHIGISLEMIVYTLRVMTSITNTELLLI